jgi:hypothetical protein
MVEESKNLDDSIEIIPYPTIKRYFEESPDNMEESKRMAFYRHNKHFYIITPAGKPIYSR